MGRRLAEITFLAALRQTDEERLKGGSAARAPSPMLGPPSERYCTAPDAASETSASRSSTCAKSSRIRDSSDSHCLTKSANWATVNGAPPSPASHTVSDQTPPGSLLQGPTWQDALAHGVGVELEQVIAGRRKVSEQGVAGIVVHRGDHAPCGTRWEVP